MNPEGDCTKAREIATNTSDKSSVCTQFTRPGTDATDLARLLAELVALPDDIRRSLVALVARGEG